MAGVDAGVHRGAWLYRALGGEHLRHRREASPAAVLRWLLSLNYAVDPEAALPRRVPAESLDSDVSDDAARDGPRASGGQSGLHA